MEQQDQSDVATLTDEEITTTPIAETSPQDTGDDSGDVADTGDDSGDDSGDTGDDSGDVADTGDTGDDS